MKIQGDEFVEWKELKPRQILRYGLIYPKHRFLCYLSGKTKRNLVSKPLGITLNITEKCNLRCKMCYWWKKDLKSEELSEAEILRIVEEIKEWGVNRINLSGGEPLLRKNVVFKVLALCQEYGIETGMVTNGMLMDQNIADQLISLGLSRISISIDGIGNTHNNIRGINGSYDKAVEAIKMINISKEKMNENCIVHLNSVLCNQNLDELLDLVELARHLKSVIWFQAVHCYDVNGTLIEDKENPLWIPKNTLNKLNEVVDRIIEIKKNESGIIGNPTKELNAFKKYFEGFRNQKQNCYAAFDTISIDSYGNVLPCWHWKSIGNINNMGIKSLWNSEKYEKILFEMQNCQLPCLLNCHFTPGSLGSLMYDMVYLPVMRITMGRY